VYDFNKNFNTKCKRWAELIIDQNGNLCNDVRIISEENSLKIEKWNGIICKQRIIITHEINPR
jgi:hypothetical protein